MFTCQYCIKTFDNKSELNKHKKGITPCLTWTDIDRKWTELISLKNNEEAKRLTLHRKFEVKDKEYTSLKNENQKLKKDLTELKSILITTDNILHDTRRTFWEQKDEIENLQQVLSKKENTIILLTEKVRLLENLENKI